MLSSDKIRFWTGYSGFEWLHLNCGANLAILTHDALLELAATINEHSFHTKNTFFENRGC